MSGADTWRGIAFQAALTTSRAMDVLEGQLGDWLDVDAGADAVDYASGTGQDVALSGQAKTRAESYDWPPGELAEILKRLIADADGADTRVEFVTDGQLSRGSSAKLLPALGRAGEGEATQADRDYLDGYGITAHMADALGRVEVISRFDSPPALLDSAVRRLRALADLDVAVTDEDAELRIGRLLRRIDECGSAPSDAESRLTRREIAEIVGVDVDVIDAATPWSEAVAGEYRRAIADLPSIEDLVELGTELQSITPTVSALDALANAPNGGPWSSTEPVLDLLDRDCLIVGPAGAGKSRSAEMLRRRAAEVGLVPVLLAPRTYTAGTLAATVGAAVSRVLGRTLSPSTGSLLLSRQETALIIDGASELDPQMRHALARDIEDVRRQLRCPTVLVAGRSVGGLRPLDLPAYQLRTLDRQLREEIAEARMGADPRPIVAELGRTLGEAAGNPLLFTMALELILAGEKVTSVGSVYAGFVNRLARNAGMAAELQSCLGVIGVACAKLVEDGRFSLDRWTWLSDFEDAAKGLRERGFINDGIAPIGVIEKLEAIGLFVADEDLSGYSLWHDSFRDWLAADAIRNGLISTPERFGRDWSTVASHLAEAGRCDDAFLHACAADLIVCTSAALRDCSDPADLAEKATLVFGRLVAEHLATDRAAALTEARVLTVDTEPGVAAYLLGPGGEDLAQALAGVQFGERVGPLRLATVLLLELLRPMLETHAPGPPGRPCEPTELARAIEEHFVARRQVMRRIVDGVVPTLAEAVSDHLGWRGLHGTVNSVTSERFGDEHRLHYTYDADVVHVDFSPEPPDDLRSSTLAEDFIRQSPEAAATDAVAEALTSLLPGFGRI